MDTPRCDANRKSMTLAERLRHFEECKDAGCQKRYAFYRHLQRCVEQGMHRLPDFGKSNKGADL